jgi:chromosome segregation ATPase
MSPHRGYILLIITAIAILMLAGCTDDTAELKQKIAELEKKVQQQQKDLSEFTGKLALPKDFSADIQRIEDQQDRISQVLKTKVDPVNTKLEEFRDWAQEAQKDRDVVAKRLKTLEQSVAEAQKRVEAEGREVARMSKEVAAGKKNVAGFAKGLEDLTKNIGDVRKEVLDNNTQLLTAVKKTLPKVKEAAVAELRDQLAPLEKALTNLKTGLEGDRKAIAAMKSQAPAEGGKDVQGLSARIKELEDVVTSQKSFMLEMGSKVHELELQLRRSLGAADAPPGLSRR